MTFETRLRSHSWHSRASSTTPRPLVNPINRKIYGEHYQSADIWEQHAVSLPFLAVSVPSKSGRVLVSHQNPFIVLTNPLAKTNGIRVFELSITVGGSQTGEGQGLLYPSGSHPIAMTSPGSSNCWDVQLPPWLMVGPYCHIHNHISSNDTSKREPKSPDSEPCHVSGERN